MDPKEYFAVVKWTVEDVIAAAQANGVTMTRKQAAEWWKKNQRWFAEKLTETGNEMLSEVNFEKI